MSETIALFPGSFDPFTRGHLEVVERTLFHLNPDKLVILVADNPDKPGFIKDRKGRVDLINRTLLNEWSIEQYRERISVAVGSPYGFTADYPAAAGKVSYIVRGVRSGEDCVTEMTMAKFNDGRGTPSFLIPTSKYGDARYSSSMVRSILGLHDSLPELEATLPNAAVDWLCREFMKARIPANQLRLMGEADAAYIDQTYHNWRHVYQLYTTSKMLGCTLEPDLAVAAVMHDVGTIEETAARFAHPVAGLIYATDHESTERQPVPPEEIAIEGSLVAVPYPSTTADDELRFHDADLFVLSQSWLRYQQYARAVRTEYSQYDDAQFKEGRNKFLTSMLGRKRIFFTPFAQNHWEAQARENMTTELNSGIRY